MITHVVPRLCVCCLEPLCAKVGPHACKAPHVAHARCLAFLQWFDDQEDREISADASMGGDDDE